MSRALHYRLAMGVAVIGLMAMAGCRSGVPGTHIAGRIVEIVPEAQSALVVTDAVPQESYWVITDTFTSITGAGGDSVGFSLMVPGFSVVAEGAKRGENGLQARSVRITSQPGISILRPRPDDRIEGSSLHVSGYARAFENNINYIAYAGKDATAPRIVHSYATARAPDVGTWGPYEFAIPLDTVTSHHVTVEVFEPSAKDGSHLNTQRVTVRLDSQ